MKPIALIALCLGYFMVIMDATIVNVTLPSISTGLNADVSWLQWIVDGYTLSFACLLLMAGYMSDRLGSKKCFQLGILFFVIASVSCGLSTSAWMLTFFRFFQGASAAFIVPSSLSLIHASITDSKNRSKAIGVLGGVGGIAAASGPMLGGILTHFFDWRAVFLVNIPFGLMCLFLTHKYIVKYTTTRTNLKLKFDMIGQILGIISIAALALSLIEIGRLGWESHSVFIIMVIFIVATIAFILTENKTKNSMFPMMLFRSKSFSIVIFVGVMMNLGFYGELFVLPLYFQEIRGYSVLMTGFALLPLMAMIALSSYLSGKVVSNIGAKKPICLGLILGAIGFIGILISCRYHLTYWVMVLPLSITGFGIAFTMPAANILIMQSVTSERTGLASAAFNSSRQIGSLIGVAIFGSIIAVSSHFIVSMQITLVIAAFVFVISGMASLIIIREN